ncbi:MAG: class E sortase [Acidimicrobiales bacterium]
MPTPINPNNPAVRVLRRSPWARRGLTAVTISLLLGAVGLLGYPFYTNLYANYRQSHLRHQLASSALRQAYLTHTVAVGDSLTRLRIPKLGVDVVVVEGTSASALRAGAGHYPDTPLPCDVGNVGIAGHRTTYGKPFNQIDKLSVGDIITLDTPIGSCVYKVSKPPFVVDPNDFSVVAPPPDPTARWLTMTSCTPKGSAAHRIVIRSEYVSGTVSST